MKNRIRFNQADPNQADDEANDNPLAGVFNNSSQENPSDEKDQNNTNFIGEDQRRFAGKNN